MRSLGARAWHSIDEVEDKGSERGTRYAADFDYLRGFYRWLGSVLVKSACSSKYTAGNELTALLKQPILSGKFDLSV